jgi:c-di-GMP-related signal transduction protein
MHTRAQAGAEESGACIARQPILKADETVVGYELLFRESAERGRVVKEEKAGALTSIDALSLVGLQVLCDGKLAFINSTRETLLADYFTMLPPDETVIEIQDEVVADKEMIEACQRLKSKRYRLALDNFVADDRRQGLVPLCDFLKVDITRVIPAEGLALAARYGTGGRLMLAYRVETRKQAVMAEKWGFARFQGYFFREPENLQVRQIPANLASYLRLLSAASQPEINYEEIENLIKHEPGLCYRLLRYVNSPLLGKSTPVQSVRNAFSQLGEKESIRWIRMATTMAMGTGRSSDLVLASLVRARFCELIAPRVEHGDCDLFLMGMLSLIDSILALPMGVAVADLGLTPLLKAQLLGAKTGKKTLLSPIYDLMLAREAGNWEEATNLGAKMNLPPSFVAATSNQAMRWAREISSGAVTENK